MRNIPNGVWPTMITPFTENGKEIDYHALESLIEWYIAKGVDGLFAVCQSSEMFYLSLQERVELAKFVKVQAGGRIPVIASGHVSESIEDQITEIKEIAATGVDAVVLVTNRLAKPEESDQRWKENAERILAAVPDVAFGLYECPYPYKRLMTPELLEWCDQSGRFLFLKDTCCHPQMIKKRIQSVQGGNLKLYNANAATLLQSMDNGAAGYSGVMANFHPELYVWLTKNWSQDVKEAAKMQAFLGSSSVIESQYYPVNAKYYLQLEGIPLTLATRTKDASLFTISQRMEVEQLREHTLSLL